MSRLVIRAFSRQKSASAEDGADAKSSSLQASDCRALTCKPALEGAPFSAMSIGSFEGTKRTPHEFSSRLQSSTNAGNISIYRKLLDDIAIDDMRTAGRVPSDKRDAVCVASLKLTLIMTRAPRPWSSHPSRFGYASPDLREKRTPLSSLS